MTTPSPRPFHVTLAICAVCVASLTGCVGFQLKLLEIEQLKTELSAVKDASTFLATQPALGGEFDGRIAIGASVFNRFLAGLDKYEVPIDEPKGAKLRFDSARLTFKDGLPRAELKATAVDSSGDVEVNVRLRADILITAEPENERLRFRFAVREILPELRWSIFRWREFWLAEAILRIEVQKYVDALPAAVMPLKADLPISVNPASRDRLWIADKRAWFDVEQSFPRFKLGYVYKVTRAISLEDGVHLFFNLTRTE